MSKLSKETWRLDIILLVEQEITQNMDFKEVIDVSVETLETNARKKQS